MKKYKYKESGKAVKFGDEITVTFEKFLEDKTVKVTHFITVDQFNVESLVGFGSSIRCLDYVIKTLLKDMYEKSIPVIIISAGVGDIIEQALINEKSNYENIYIYSNFLKYENEKIVGTKSKELIHPLNKSEIIMSDDLKAKISNIKNILLFGNNLYDIKMTNNEKNVFKIGFLDENIEEKIEEYKAFYDIVCTDNSSYFDLKKTLWGHLPKTGTF